MIGAAWLNTWLFLPDKHCILKWNYVLLPTFFQLIAHCDSFGANETNDFYEDDDAESIGSSKSKDQLMNVVTTSSPKSGVKITGTIKMMKPLEVQPSKSFLKTIYKDLEDQDTEYSEKGCMHSAQRWAVTIWSTLFDWYSLYIPIYFKKTKPWRICSKEKSKKFSSLKINLMIFRFHLELYTHKLLQKNELKSLYFHILYKNIHKNAWVQ